MKINPILALLLLSALVGCSASREMARNTNSVSDTVAMRPVAEFRPNMGAALDGETVHFHMAVGSGSSTSASTAQSVASFNAVMRKADGTLIDSISTSDIPSSGQKNTQTNQVSSTRYATLDWDRTGSNLTGASADLALTDDNGDVLASQRILFDTLATRAAPRSSTPKSAPVSQEKTSRNTSLDIQLEVRSLGGGVEFLVTVTRTAAPPEGEYLSSGEQYRIGLTTQLGEPIWSTNEGRAFTQQIGPVMPTTVGESVRYRDFWNGRDPRTRKFAAPGRYKVLVTIPARPIPYTLQEEIQLGGDQ